MKQLLLFVLIAAAVLQQAHLLKAAPNVDTRLEEVYQKHIVAMGGKAKLEALKTYQYTITNNEQQTTLSFKKPGLFIRTFTTDKGSGADLIRGCEGWYKNVDGSATKNGYAVGITRDIITWSLHGFLWDAKRLHYKLELLKPAEAAENVSSNKSIYRFRMNDACLVVKAMPMVKEALHREFYIYIDPETCLIRIIIENNGDSMNNFVFSDYVLTDGMNMFTRVDKGSEGRTTSTLLLSTAKLNIPLDDKLFVSPVVTKK